MKWVWVITNIPASSDAPGVLGEVMSSTGVTSAAYTRLSVRPSSPSRPPSSHRCHVYADRLPVHKIKMAPVLPDGWEAVAAEDGRTYYWNVNTNETVWEAPTTAHSPIAASFLNMAAASSESGRQAAAGILNTSSGSSEGGSTPTSESGRSKALGVDAMRKYREAKEAEAKASPQSRPGERPAPPPKVDLYK